MIRTARLVLRRWTDADLAPFAALNADAEVMEHFPEPLDREQSDAFAARAEEGFATHGFGLWVVDDGSGLVGVCGLTVPRDDLPCSPSLEVGWRFARGAWGRGYATEAAAAAILDGRERGVGEVVSFTAATNTRSARVMQRLGMVPDGTFEHPALPAGHPLRRHVLYRLPADRAPATP